MKAIKYYLFIIIILTTGCSEDFLDLNPPSSPNANAVYKTEADFQQAVIGIYDRMQAVYNNLWQFTELRADNADHLWTGYDAIQRVDQYRMDPADGVLNGMWLNLYNTIERANTTLLYLEDADSQALRNSNRHEGEAKFLRGLAYFHLAQIWGDVPVILDPIGPEEAFDTPQQSQSTVFEQAISDFSDAADLLPADYPAGEIGRATSGAAKSMLGKTYLAVDNFSAAEPVLADVMDMGYELLPDFDDVFDHMNEHHAEYIFDIEYEPDLSGEGSIFTNRFIPNNPELRDHFSIGGGSQETLSPTAEFMSLYEIGDNRRAITADTGFVQSSGEFFKTNHSFTSKYITPVLAENDSRANWKVTRFADVILMYAEALNENGKTEEAIEELNRIRVRADASSYPATLSQAEVRDAISLERRLELAFEGHRWYDLVRTGKAIEVLTAKEYNIQPHMTLFAKPQQQLDVVNDPQVFSQNQGY